MATVDPLLAHGIREATGTQRPAPGILCWNCHRLTPFPSRSCKWCRAAFAGTAGGAVPDAIPDQTVRGRLSIPDVPAVHPRRRIVRPPAPSVGSPARGPAARPRPSAATAARNPGPKVVAPVEPRGSSTPSKSMLLTHCPVCAREAASGAQECECGAVFGDAMTTFNCVECGSVMPIDAHRCAVCGNAFGGRGGTSYACPLCGMSVAEEANVCECGARFAD